VGLKFIPISPCGVTRVISKDITLQCGVAPQKANPRYLKKGNTRHNLEGCVGDITHSDLVIRRFLSNFNRSSISGMEAELHILVATEVAMLVKDLMTSNVSSCRPENNLAELAEVMRKQRCGALPIVDGSGSVTGIITDRDICIALGTRNIRASDVRARDVSHTECISCSSDNDVRDALRTMATKEVSRLPVVDEAGQLVGIVSIDDIIFRAGGGRSGLSDREIIDTMRAMREERIHQPDAVTKEGSDLRSDIRMPMNYEHVNKRR
jgi:CBS domain-containing protein